MIGQNRLQIIESLNCILKELKTKKIESTPGFLSYVDSLKELDEYINYANEYGIAYESIVGLLEAEQVEITGRAAVALLEVGLLLGYKTEREQDRSYDLRPKLLKDSQEE